MANPYRILALGVLGTLGIAAASLFVRSDDTERPEPPALLPSAYAKPVEVAYADTLRKGETLSELMERTRLDQEEARRLLAEIQALQDPRRVQAGLVIQYRKSTRDGSTRGVDLKLDADHRLTVDGRRGRFVSRVEEVPVKADTTVLAGTVRSSLYQALLDGEGTVPRAERERIADVLADRIFAWKVDFSKDLREGDTYRVVYERMARPDGTARSARVLGVQFTVGGRLQEAYLFTVGGAEDYYDADGESLRRAFLRAPLEFRRISSTFSKGRYHPILHRIRAHHGIDYAASTGTPVRAVGDGVVAKAGWGGGYGNVVQLRHQRGYGSRYAHLSRFASGIRAGVRVKQGDVIGYVGSTGLSTGPHLHYEFHEGGRPVNPASIRFITGEPVPSGARARFRELVRARVARMERAGGPALAVKPSESNDRGGE